MSLFTFTLHRFVCWGVLTPPSWQKYRCGCSDPLPRQDAVPAQGSTSNVVTLAERYEKTLCGVDKAFEHWSDLNFWKLTVVSTAVSFGPESETPFTRSSEGLVLSQEEEGALPASGADDFLGQLENVEWKWQIDIWLMWFEKPCACTWLYCAAPAASLWPLFAWSGVEAQSKRVPSAPIRLTARDSVASNLEAVKLL